MKARYITALKVLCKFFMCKHHVFAGVKPAAVVEWGGQILTEGARYRLRNDQYNFLIGVRA